MMSMVKSLPAWIERPPHVTEYAAGSHDELVRDLARHEAQDETL